MGGRTPRGAEWLILNLRTNPTAGQRFNSPTLTLTRFLTFDFSPTCTGYRGIRYTVGARIEREQGSVAIHPAGVELASKIINGPRLSAELQAHSMIDRWLEKRPAQK